MIIKDRDLLKKLVVAYLKDDREKLKELITENTNNILDVLNFIKKSIMNADGEDIINIIKKMSKEAEDAFVKDKDIDSVGTKFFEIAIMTYELKCLSDDMEVAYKKFRNKSDEN